MKKAQTEIMGLIVIVILIIVIFFIFLTFIGKESKDSILTDSLITGEVLNAVMLYTPRECADKSIFELVEQKQNSCCGSSADACKAFLEREIGAILGVGIRGLYKFEINDKTPQGDINYITIGVGCTGKRFVDEYKRPRFNAKLERCSN